MKGTVHEDDWVVYHDALVLMTSAESQEYMEQKGFRNCIVFPKFGVCNHLGVYKNRVVGNHPYLMPLDAHLNQDLHSAHKYHCILTQDLDDDNANKFSMKTPKLMERGYLKLWEPDQPGREEGCPSSSRILTDINNVIHRAYPALYQNRGIAVHHLCERSGRRRQEVMLGKKPVESKRGGARKKSENYDIGDNWVHPSVRHLLHSPEDSLVTYRAMLEAQERVSSGSSTSISPSDASATATDSSNSLVASDTDSSSSLSASDTDSSTSSIAVDQYANTISESGSIAYWIQQRFREESLRKWEKWEKWEKVKCEEWNYCLFLFVFV